MFVCLVVILCAQRPPTYLGFKKKNVKKNKNRVQRLEQNSGQNKSKNMIAVSKVLKREQFTAD